MRKNYQTKGIFCLEGLWDKDLKSPSSVRPILELLKINCRIDYIYKDCATKEELEFYIKKWLQSSYAAFPILYLASHGDQFCLCLGNYDFTLDELSELLKNKCQNRIVIFGSCKTLDVDKRHLKRFLRETEALAVCGYCMEVDWLRSTAFELLLLSELQENEFSGRGIDSMQTRALEIAKLFKELDFRMVTIKD